METLTLVDDYRKLVTDRETNQTVALDIFGDHQADRHVKDSGRGGYALLGWELIRSYSLSIQVKDLGSDLLLTAS